MPSLPESDAVVAWFADWPLRSLQFALQLQQMQFEAWRAWQGGLQDWQGQLLDGWICRWGGGVPLDG